MNHITTPSEASAEWPCPLGRTFHPPRDTCRGSDCPLWRWLPIPATDPAFQSAIAREMSVIASEKGSKSTSGYHKQAVENVMRDPKAYGVKVEPVRGWCGLGGRPEV